MLDNNPNECLNKVTEFLDLDAIELNSEALKPYNQSIEKRNFSKVGNRILKHGSQVGSISRYLPSRIKMAINNLVSVPTNRYVLTEVQKRYVARQLSEDVLKFKDFVGDQVNVSGWEIHQFIE